MRVYLSGPMRGLPEHNWPAFHESAAELRAMGHTVLNPAESFDGKPGANRTDCLRHDIQLILIVDAVVVIDNWLNSPGACFEVAEAWQVGLPVFRIENGTLVEISEVQVKVPRENQYLAKIPLLGLSGYAGAGKDEVAKTLVDRGWTRVAFADPLKDIASDIGWSGKKDEEGRRLLQNLGVAVREHLGQGSWVEAGEEQIERTQGPVVVTDVRFPNEMQMIRRRGGRIARVVRPGTGPANEHVSEHAVTEEDCDMLIENTGSLDDLQKLIVKLDQPGGEFHEPVKMLA